MLHVEGHQYKMLSTLQHEDFPDDSDSTRSARDENEYIKVSLSWMTYDRMQKTTSHAVGFNMMKSHLPVYALLGITGLGDGDGSDGSDVMDSSAILVLARDRNLFNACHMVPGDAVRILIDQLIA